MQAFRLTWLTILAAAATGCRTDVTFVAPQAGAADVAAAGELADVAADRDVEAPLDDCSRYVSRADGSLVCLDDILPALLEENPRDNDGDGVPNINDDDIDGDGIPNGYDLDVDGDGEPNSFDEDIDDDGVPNAIDVDIDGDFLRNRWDLDMDGDLLYNPHDPDADGDGRLKFPAIIDSECGPVELFNDPEVCKQECTPSSSDGPAGAGGAGNGDGGAGSGDGAAGGSGSSGKEDECEDKGAETTAARPDAPGQNVTPGDAPTVDAPAAGDAPAEPTPTEIDLLENALEEELPGGDTVTEEIREAYPEATEGDVLDAVAAQREEAVAAGESGDAGGLADPISESAAREFSMRRDSLIGLAALGVDLDEAVDTTERFAAAVTAMNATLQDLVTTVQEIDANLPGSPHQDDGRLAVALMDTAVTVEIPAAEVPEAIAPTAQAAEILGGGDVTESVWQIVVNQVADYQREDGGFDFSLPKVALAVERVSTLLDDPTLEVVNESVANVLAAAAEEQLSDPLAVVMKLEQLADTDPNFDISDGINAEEAERGATEVANEA